MGFDEEFDEDLDDDLEFEMEDIEPIETEEPTQKVPSIEGKKILVFFISTIGPGEKKQQLTVNSGNIIGEIKETVGNLFGLNPDDFHLSCGGITMDENNPLNEYNISEGDDILLIPASIAG